MKGSIKIKVTEDSMGNILLSPCYDRDRHEISQLNEYDHGCEVYLQVDYDRQWFIENYPKARYRISKHEGEFWGGYKVGKLWYFVNDGVKFYIDSWDYCHMVGGMTL